MCFVVRISLMKLIGYQQLTCLCVKMEFVVEMVSFSCELYSLSWSCFRSRWSGTNVYGKWCFDLHVECYGSCMVSTKGERAGEFLGIRRIFARIFPNLPEKFWATLSTNPPSNNRARSPRSLLLWLGALVLTYSGRNLAFYLRHVTGMALAITVTLR